MHSMKMGDYEMSINCEDELVQKTTVGLFGNEVKNQIFQNILNEIYERLRDCEMKVAFHRNTSFTEREAANRIMTMDERITKLEANIIDKVYSVGGSGGYINSTQDLIDKNNHIRVLQCHISNLENKIDSLNGLVQNKNNVIDGNIDRIKSLEEKIGILVDCLERDQHEIDNLESKKCGCLQTQGWRS